MEKIDGARLWVYAEQLMTVIVLAMERVRSRGLYIGRIHSRRVRAFLCKASAMCA